MDYNRLLEKEKLYLGEFAAKSSSKFLTKHALSHWSFPVPESVHQFPADRTNWNME
jgi:hypothetical protein